MKIDIHQHFLTPRYLEEMAAAGITNVDGFPLPHFDTASTIAVLDKFEISTAMLSVSSPGVAFTQGVSAAALARSLNEDCASMIAAHPRRFGGFAVLPLPDIDAALAEIEYAIDVLKLDGIGLLTNYNGHYLAEARFRPVFDAINRRKAVVFFHPTQPPGFAALSQSLPAPMLEYPFDTTRMIAGLISAGILRDFTDMRLIVAHGGGTIPYLTQRIIPLLSGFAEADPPFTPDDVARQLKSLYYDLTATSSPSTIEALRHFVPADHLLYGTDFPFMPEFTIPAARPFLESGQYFSEDDRALYYYKTAQGLFPRLAG